MRVIVNEIPLSAVSSTAPDWVALGRAIETQSFQADLEDGLLIEDLEHLLDWGAPAEGREEQVRGILRADLELLKGLWSDPEAGGEIEGHQVIEVTGDRVTIRGNLNPRPAEYRSPYWAAQRLLDSGLLDPLGYELLEARDTAATSEDG